jgi:hypothetical protein
MKRIGGLWEQVVAFENLLRAADAAHDFRRALPRPRGTPRTDPRA